MTRRLFIISILLFVTTFSCQKKLFKTVTVTGRLVDESTQQPLANTKVALYTDDVTSAKNSAKNTIGLVSTNTNSDGTFKLKSNASKRNSYYIRCKNSLTTASVNGFNSFSVSDNSTKYLGNVIAPK